MKKGASEEGIQGVWKTWLEAKRLPVTRVIDAKSRDVIAARLDFGFTPAQLSEVIRLLVQNPALIRLKEVRSLQRPLGTDRRVSDLLGIKYEPPVRENWMTPFERTYRARYPNGDFPYGLFARLAHPLVRQYGHDAVLQDFVQYLAVERFPNWRRWKETYGQPRARFDRDQGRYGSNRGGALDGVQ